jgi:hypothetical protein
MWPVELGKVNPAAFSLGIKEGKASLPKAKATWKPHKSVFNVPHLHESHLKA